MTPLKLAATLTLTLLCGSAHAQFRDGNKLLSELNGAAPVLAIGYIMGVADAYLGITHCAPENVTAGQIRDMVRNFLDNTPTIRHLPANDIVDYALKTTWPCAQKKKGTGV